MEEIPTSRYHGRVEELQPASIVLRPHSYRSYLGFSVLFLLAGIYITQGVRLSLIQSEADTSSTITQLAGWRSYEEMVEQDIITEAEPILEFMFIYTGRGDTERLSLQSARRINGYVPSRRSGNKAYHLDLLDGSNESVYETVVSLSDTVTVGGGTAVITIPWRENAIQLRLRDMSGKLVLQVPIARIPFIDTVPDFYSARGNEIMNRAVPFQRGQDDFLDIAFVGDGYTDPNRFHEDVAYFSEALIGTTFAQLESSHIYIHYTDAMQDFACGSTPQPVLCDQSRVMRLVNEAGMPAERVIVLQQNPNSATEHGRIVADYN